MFETFFSTTVPPNRTGEPPPGRRPLAGTEVYRLRRPLGSCEQLSSGGGQDRPPFLVSSSALEESHGHLTGAAIIYRTGPAHRQEPVFRELRPEGPQVSKPEDEGE